MEINFCPRWILTKLNVPERIQHHFAILISTLLILLFVPKIPHVPHLCLMKKFLGIPCPGCGISHSLMAAFSIDLGKAWSQTLLVLPLHCFFAIRLWRGRLPLRCLKHPEPS